MSFPHKTSLIVCILAAVISSFIASFGAGTWMFLIPYIILSYFAVQTMSDLFFDKSFIPKLVWVILFGLAYAISWNSSFSKLAFSTGCVFLLSDIIWLCNEVYKKEIKPRFR